MGDTAVLFYDKSHDNPALNIGFLCFYRIFDVFVQIAHQSGHTAVGKFGHVVYDFKNPVVGVFLFNFQHGGVLLHPNIRCGLLRSYVYGLHDFCGNLSGGACHGFDVAHNHK